MTPDPAQLRFFFDESVLGLGKAMAIARKDVVHTGHALVPEIPLGCEDVDWMPAVARRRLVVVARDKRIRTKPAELKALREHGLRVFWIAGKRDLSNWDALVRVVRRWQEIERLVSQRPDGPWFMAVMDGGLNELRVSATGGLIKSPQGGLSTGC